MASISEVARLAGGSAATASRVVAPSDSLVLRGSSGAPPTTLVPAAVRTPARVAS